MIKRENEEKVFVVITFNTNLISVFVDDYRTGGFRERNRRDWDNHSFNRRDRPVTTKSGRVIKGRGKFVSLHSTYLCVVLRTVRHAFGVRTESEYREHFFDGWRRKNLKCQGTIVIHSS